MKIHELILLRTEPSIAVGIAVAIFVLVIIPLFGFLYKYLKSKTLFFSRKYKDILDLKHHLRNVEREIESYKEIKDTGNMTEKEEQEWIKLARKHKEINQMIVSLTNTKDNTHIEWIENPIDEYVAEKIEKLKEEKVNKYKYSMKEGETMREYRERLENISPFYALFRTYILLTIMFWGSSTLFAVLEVISWDSNGAFVVPILILISPICTIVLHRKFFLKIIKEIER